MLGVALCHLWEKSEVLQNYDKVRLVTLTTMVNKQVSSFFFYQLLMEEANTEGMAEQKWNLQSQCQDPKAKYGRMDLKWRENSLISGSLIKCSKMKSEPFII